MKVTSLLLILLILTSSLCFASSHTKESLISRRLRDTQKSRELYPVPINCKKGYRYASGRCRKIE